MEEKILIKGNAQGFKSIPVVILLLGLILSVGVSYMITVPYSEDYMLPFTITGGAILMICGIVLLLYVNNCEIVVTDKRIYGKAAFGVRVDIPADCISAVGTITLFHGISVSSSSGKIKLLYISNANEIHKVISDILINRQPHRERNLPLSDTAEELKKYKELLDSGAITQDEFSAKKKQLLGL